MAVLFFSVADYNSSDQKTACRRHELYVSFRELGWQVGNILLFKTSNQLRVYMCETGTGAVDPHSISLGANFDSVN